MRDIYTPGGAIQVLVWLGEEGTAKLALQEGSNIMIDKKVSQLQRIVKRWVHLESLCEKEVAELGRSSEIRPLIPVEHLTRAVNTMDFLLRQSGEYPFSNFDEWSTKLTELIEVFSMVENGPSERLADIQKRKSVVAKKIVAFQSSFNACCELFKERPWWTRAWIIQEVAHAGKVTVQIGKMDPILLDDILAWRENFSIWAIYVKVIQWNTKEESAEERKLQAVLAPLQILRHASRDLLLFREKTKKDGPIYTSLGYPILLFRDRQATDEKDKIYAFIGLSGRGGSLIPNYNVSKSDVYIPMTRIIYREALRYILAVECRTREVKIGGDLPSWVPDFNLTQDSVPLFKLRVVEAGGFCADLDFPTLPYLGREPYLEQGNTDPNLIIRGIQVGFVTAVFDVELPRNFWLDTNTVRLLQYTTNHIPLLRSHTRSADEHSLLNHRESSSENHGFSSQSRGSSQEAAQHSPQPTDSSVISMLNTSWAPCHTQIGDIIIDTPGCDIPLVLRKDGDVYLFVGGVWLIDSEMIVPKIGVVYKFEIKDNPGFSRFMYGAACAGKTLEDVQIFTLC